MTDVTIREIADPREITDEPGPPSIPPVSTREEAEAKRLPKPEPCSPACGPGARHKHTTARSHGHRPGWLRVFRLPRLCLRL
jgi:hypothetical protein